MCRRDPAGSGVVVKLKAGKNELLVKVCQNNMTESWAQVFGFLGVLLASVNIFGGFVVTQRMLGMFQSNKPKARS